MSTIKGKLHLHGAPVQIYNWISQSREEFHHLAAAAIILLPAILLLMNAVAIWLRSRYSHRW